MHAPCTAQEFEENPLVNCFSREVSRNFPFCSFLELLLCATHPVRFIAGHRHFPHPVSSLLVFPLTSQFPWTLLALRRERHKTQQMKLMSLKKAVFHSCEWGQRKQWDAGSGKQRYQLPEGRCSAREDRVAVNVSYKRNRGVAGERALWCFLAPEGGCSCKLQTQNVHRTILVGKDPSCHVYCCLQAGKYIWSAYFVII